MAVEYSSRTTSSKRSTKSGQGSTPSLPATRAPTSNTYGRKKRRESGRSPQRRHTERANGSHQSPKEIMTRGRGSPSKGFRLRDPKLEIGASRLNRDLQPNL